MHFLRVALPLHLRIQWINSFKILHSIVWNNMNSYEERKKPQLLVLTLVLLSNRLRHVCYLQWCDHNRIKIWNHKLFLWLTDGRFIIIILFLLHLCHICVVFSAAEKEPIICPIYQVFSIAIITFDMWNWVFEFVCVASHCDCVWIHNLWITHRWEQMEILIDSIVWCQWTEASQ